MSDVAFSSKYRRELLNLVFVVLIIGLVTDILASSVYSFLPTSILDIPTLIWLILVLIPVTFGVIIILILIPKTTRVIVYFNIMVNKVNRHIFSSEYSTSASQHSDEFFKALTTDKSPLAKEILEDLDRFKKISLSFDLIEYLIFLILLSGFEPFWASKTVKSYGYPARPRNLGQITHYLPTSIYSLKNQAEETLKKVLPKFTHRKDLEYKDLQPIVERNRLMKHFMEKTSLNSHLTPQNFVICLPKGTKITIEREPEHKRVIKLSNRYTSIEITVTKHSESLGLPYSVGIKEKNYDESKYTTANFQIEFNASMSRPLSILSRIEHYYAWTNNMLKKLVANFALSRKGVFEEIEVP